MKKTLLKNLYLLKRDRVIRGSIGITGDTIAFVGEIPETFAPDEAFDYGFQSFAFPGLFNAHTHLSMVLLRNYADGLPLMQWLEEKIWPAEAKMTPDDIYYGALLGMIELIRSGCTAFRDMYDHMDRVAEATIASGLRGVIGQGMIMLGESDLSKLDIARDLAARFSGHPRMRVEVAPHAPYTCTDEALMASKALADELNTTLHIHLSESDAEYTGSLSDHGISPTERMERLGILSEKTAAAHCAKMSDRDLKILADHRVSVLLNPSSNLKLGNGIARAKEMQALGINLSIGTDGASSNNNLNMMEELHLAALLYGMTPVETVKAATLGGAVSAHWDSLGVLEEGYLADIAVMDLGSAHLTPHGDLISALCYSAASFDVASLIVGGEFVMRDRRILTLDEEEIKAKCREIAERLLQEEQA